MPIQNRLKKGYVRRHEILEAVKEKVIEAKNATLGVKKNKKNIKKSSKLSVKHEKVVANLDKHCGPEQLENIALLLY